MALKNTCPQCGRADVALREDGTLRRHRDETQEPCEGSWSLPQRREIPDVLRLPHDEEDDEHPLDA